MMKMLWMTLAVVTTFDSRQQMTVMIMATQWLLCVDALVSLKTAIDKVFSDHIHAVSPANSEVVCPNDDQ